MRNIYWHGKINFEIEEYDEELNEEREKFIRFRLTYTHQLEEMERLRKEKEFSKAQLLEDYIVTEYIRLTHSIRARELLLNTGREK